MATHRMREVFVAGGMPRLTYVARQERKLEDELRKASDNLCKLVTVTGDTKSGKTVLTKRVFPKDNVVWLDGGTVSDETELWHAVLDQTGGSTYVEQTQEEGTEHGISATIEAEANALVVKGKGSIEPSRTSTKAHATRSARQSSPKTQAIAALTALRRPIVIDDFHYLSRDVQGKIVRALKAPIFDGLPVILLAIPHRRYDAVRVEKEMTARVQNIQVPAWNERELRQIADKGFELLRLIVNPMLVTRFCSEAQGSPHLIQEFCRQLCEENSIEQTMPEPTAVEPAATTEDLFRRVAESTSRIIFDRLEQGPRQRSDRKMRRFADGSTGDIYVAVLRAIARLKPGVQTVDYEDIRGSLRHVLDEGLPQLHEVSRVLEQMSKICADDEASVPVIDWDKEGKLHITDPFFAFFLRWGAADGTPLVSD